MANEYIDLEKAKQLPHIEYAYAAEKLLDEVPVADVAPVVRCKGCKYNVGTKKCLHPDSFLRCRRTTISAPTERERT